MMCNRNWGYEFCEYIIEPVSVVFPTYTDLPTHDQKMSQSIKVGLLNATPFWIPLGN